MSIVFSTNKIGIVKPVNKDVLFVPPVSICVIPEYTPKVSPETVTSCTKVDKTPGEIFTYIVWLSIMGSRIHTKLSGLFSFPPLPKWDNDKPRIFELYNPTPLYNRNILLVGNPKDLTEYFVVYSSF